MSQASRKYAADADTWLQWAEHTYAGTQTLFRSQNPFLWFSAAILGHQALEMFLKAALIRHGHRGGKKEEGGDVWSHNLKSLLDKLSSHGVIFPDVFRAKLCTFDDYFYELRYLAEMKNIEGLGREEGPYWKSWSRFSVYTPRWNRLPRLRKGNGASPRQHP